MSEKSGRPLSTSLREPIALRRCLIASMSFIVMLAFSLLQAAPNPFAGTWTADLTRSKQHPGYEFKSVVIEIAVVGNTVTITDKHVYANGKETSGVHTFEADGHQRPFEAPAVGPGLTLVAAWSTPRILDTVVRKDGTELTRVVYEVSADRKTLTATRTGMLPQVVVFTRQ